jgi:hypothetical protein
MDDETFGSGESRRVAAAPGKQSAVVPPDGAPLPAADGQYVKATINDEVRAA